MAVRVIVANSSQETGQLLIDMLKDHKAYDHNAKAIVAFGTPVQARPNLNGNCGLNKIERLTLMNKGGVRTIPWFRGDKVPTGFKFPVLARKSHGFGGTDIIPCFQAQEVEWRAKAGWDWFSSFVPVKTELRVWVFRGEHLDTYEKTMKRPLDYKFIGRNIRNGFDFAKIEGRTDVIKECSRALDVLKLDFGAVDVLIGEDDQPYILEINTAPGCIQSKAQDTLRKLANKIVEWDNSGFKDE